MTSWVIVSDGREAAANDASNRARPKSSTLTRFSGAISDIRRLDVAMHDANGVSCLHASAISASDRQCFGQWHLPAADPLGERRALHQLHDDDGPAGSLLQAENGGNIGVVERG